MDYEEAMVGTVDVPAKDKLDVNILTEWMKINVSGFAGPLTMSKFKGGQSNPTYRLDTPDRSYVLRRQPFGKLLPSAHAVDREYTVMAALHPTGFPVPKPYGLCEDPALLGSKFFVMALADGRSLWDGALPGREPDERRAIYHAMIDTMADLHSGSRCDRPDRLRQADRLLRAADRPLVEAVQAVRNRTRYRKWTA